MNLKVRLARLNDARKIWEIRNETGSRAIAANQNIIPLDQHVAWFKKKYFNQNGHFCFIGEIDGNIAGYCRFDLKENHYLNSIAINSTLHGKGIGTLLLSESIKKLNLTIPILAEVRKHNLASVKIFEKNGFKRVSENEENYYYQFSKK